MKKNKNFVILIIIVLTPLILNANNNMTEKINWFMLILGLIGGLTLFLYGIDKLSEGLKKTAGQGLRKIFALMSKNKLLSFLFGILITVMLQSSSATTVMLVSLVNSGLMQFAQTSAIILGANIGSTVTSQLIAFKLTDYSLLFVAIGYLMFLLFKKDIIKNIGFSIFGFGLLFFGMDLMGSAMDPLKTYQPFVDILKNFDNLYFNILIGLVFTAIIQSSGAFIGIVIVMSLQGFITLNSAIGMILGANIGTCFTAFLASLNTTRNAKRVALSHIFFKTIGVILFIFWIPKFQELVIYISNFFGADIGRQIANAHTIYNIINALVLLPFTNLTAKLVLKIMPDKLIDEKMQPKIRHLDKSVINNPIIAISLARQEIANAITLTNRMMQDIMTPFIQKNIAYDTSYTKLTIEEAIIMREEKIDFLEIKITEYLTLVTKKEINKKISDEVFTLISVINYIESIADVITEDILPLIPQMHSLNNDFSNEGKTELIDYQTRIRKQLSRLEEYFKNHDIKKAKSIIEKWEKYVKIDSDIRTNHYIRLNNNEKTQSTHKIHMELLVHFQEIGNQIDRIAKILLKY
jgi:phosphate:Na+ symporter